MFCMKCGNELLDDSVFCDKCGLRLADHVKIEACVAADTTEQKVELDLFDLELYRVGPNKIKVVKVLYERTGLDLRTAKQLVDYAPQIFMRAVTKTVAEFIAAEFANVGALVNLIPHKGERISSGVIETQKPEAEPVYDIAETEIREPLKKTIKEDVPAPESDAPLRFSTGYSVKYGGSLVMNRGKLTILGRRTFERLPDGSDKRNSSERMFPISSIRGFNVKKTNIPTISLVMAVLFLILSPFSIYLCVSEFNFVTFTICTIPLIFCILFLVYYRRYRYVRLFEITHKAGSIGFFILVNELHEVETFMDKLKHSLESEPHVDLTPIDTVAAAAKINENKVAPNIKPIVVADNSALKYLVIIGCVVYAILFFFPWVKVIGQEWFALFGYGSNDGFSPLHFVPIFWDIIRNVDFLGALLFLGLFCMMILPAFRSLWAMCVGVSYIVRSQRKQKKIWEYITGPITFIVGYFIMKALIEYGVGELTSSDWLGKLAGNIYANNLVKLTFIPWVMLALGALNWYLTKKYLESLPTEDF